MTVRISRLYRIDEKWWKISLQRWLEMFFREVLLIDCNYAIARQKPVNTDPAVCSPAPHFHRQFPSNFCFSLLVSPCRTHIRGLVIWKWCRTETFVYVKTECLGQIFCDKYKIRQWGSSYVQPPFWLSGGLQSERVCEKEVGMGDMYEQDQSRPGILFEKLMFLINN